ncbi:hypothetical protein [Paenibacillus sp. NPDC055715]
MNYMDEHILSLKNKFNHDVASNNVNTNRSQADVPDQDNSAAEQNRVLRMGDELIPLEWKTILDGQMAVSIPQFFILMPLEQARFKYPSEHRPQIIYTSLDGTVNVTFNPTESALEVDGLPGFVEQMAEVLRSVQPIRNWIGTEMIVNRSGLSIGIIRFVAAGVDTNLYNEILLFIHKGQVMMGTFNCMESDLEAWLPVVENTVQSLQRLPIPSSSTFEKGVDSL